MKSAGVLVDKVAITDEPSTITNVMRAYLVAHKDTDAIWNVTLLTTPFVYKVVQGLGMLNQVKMAAVDESPLAIEGILQGKLIATHSQQFWLQGFLPVMWRCLYKCFLWPMRQCGKRGGAPSSSGCARDCRHWDSVYPHFVRN